MSGHLGVKNQPDGKVLRSEMNALLFVVSLTSAAFFVFCCLLICVCILLWWYVLGFQEVLYNWYGGC